MFTAKPMTANAASRTTISASSGTLPTWSQPSQLAARPSAGPSCSPCTQWSSHCEALAPIRSPRPSTAAIASSTRLATRNGELSGASIVFMLLLLPARLQLREPLFDAVTALQVLQLLQLGGVGGDAGREAGDAGLPRHHAVERRARVVDPGARAAGGAGLCSGRRVARARGDELLERLLHLALFREQRGDVALELLAALQLFGERLLQHRHLVLDVDLLLESAAREILAVLPNGELDLAGELLVLRVELVELGRHEVLGRLDAAELGADLVDDLVDLAHGLRHRGLGSGVLDRVEQRVHAAADDAGNTGGNVVGHDYSPFRCLRSAEIRSASSITLPRCRSMAEGS